MIKKFSEPIKGLSKPYRVEVNKLHDTGRPGFPVNNTDQEWVPCPRCDLIPEDIVTEDEDGDMLIEIEPEATFCSLKDAETFITVMCDLMPYGKRKWFRIVNEKETSA